MEVGTKAKNERTTMSSWTLTKIERARLQRVLGAEAVRCVRGMYEALLAGKWEEVGTGGRALMIATRGAA